MLHINGSRGEGGGQIVRTALALSVLTGHPITIDQIRANRPRPGLQAQHLEALHALQKLSGAQVKGNELQSTRVSFTPGKITTHDLHINIPTAGSIALVLQALMPAACAAEDTVHVTFAGGATHGKWAPPLPYLDHVMIPLLEHFGYYAEIHTDRFGYYPLGDARASAVIIPRKLKPGIFDLRGTLIAIKGISHASRDLQKARVAERQQQAAQAIFATNGIEVDIEVQYVDTKCPGSGIDLEAVFQHTNLGANALGEKGKSAESVGSEAARELVALLGKRATVDRHAADQLLPFMALAPGSRIIVPEITGHVQTNMDIIEQFLPVKFAVKNGNEISVTDVS